MIGLVAADFPDHRIVTAPDGRAELVPQGGGPALSVSERVEKRFLGRTMIAGFQMVFPAARWGQGRLQVQHTGRMRRQGIDVRFTDGSVEVAELAARLGSDSEFTCAAFALDFTRFDLELDGANGVALVELMGGSLVSIAFPPIRSYVRVPPDQSAALVATLTALVNTAA